MNQDNKQQQLTVTGIKRRRRRMQEHLICMCCHHAAYIHTVSMRSRLCTAVCSFCPSPSELPLSPSRNSIRPSVRPVRPDVFVLTRRRLGMAGPSPRDRSHRGLPDSRRAAALARRSRHRQELTRHHRGPPGLPPTDVCIPLPSVAETEDRDASGAR